MPDMGHAEYHTYNDICSAQIKLIPISSFIYTQLSTLKSKISRNKVASSSLFTLND